MINPDFLTGAITGRREVVLESRDIYLIARQLDLRCRDVEDEDALRRLVTVRAVFLIVRLIVIGISGRELRCFSESACSRSRPRRSDSANKAVLQAAEAAGFDAIVTTDQNLCYQQNLAGRRLAILVLLTTDWRLIRKYPDFVTQAVDALAPGAYHELRFPPAART